MRGTYAVIVVTLLFVVTGGLVMLGASVRTGTRDFLAAQHEPRPSWAKLTDDEYIPVPQDAYIFGAVEESHLFRRLIYETALEESEVERFHDTHLLPLGWARPVGGAANSIGVDHIWTDPTGAIPWHLELDVTVNPLDNGRNYVTLIFSRYPDPERTLTVYPGSETATRQTTRGPGDPRFGGYPVEVITSTFVTDSSPSEVEAFYNETLPSHAWIFFQLKDGKGQVAQQPGKIDVPPGIYFRGNGPGSQGSESTVYWLFVTARADKDGRTLVEQRMTIQPFTIQHPRR